MKGIDNEQEKETVQFGIQSQSCPGSLKNEETVPQLAARYEIHPTMIHTWKRNLLEGAANIFDKGHKRDKQSDAKVDELYRHIGKLKVERDFLSKKLSL